MMTLALNDREMQILEQLADRHGLTKVGVLRSSASRRPSAPR